jgi:large subunit ribosomal protein L18
MKKTSKQRRKTKLKEKIRSSGRGRKLTVFKSNKYIWAQIVDVHSGKTLISANTKSLISDKPKLSGKTKTKQAFELGKLIAKKANKKNIKRIVFDRGFYRYHGRVKALAEGSREGGLKF